MNVAFEASIAETVAAAFREDFGVWPTVDGDITTDMLINDYLTGVAVISANQEGVAAGAPVAQVVFRMLDPTLALEIMADDGARTNPGRELIRIKGKLKPILKGERTALNFLSRLSGIATLTSLYVRALAGTGVDIYDTRKTTPGLRALEKYAVTVGGGHNHRFGLYDGLLIKDNHLVVHDTATAVSLAKETAPGRMIEVEVETLKGLEEAIRAGADIIMLDNMDIETLSKAIAIAKGKAKLEVSGGINLSNVREIASLGPDRISIGALTHGAAPLDLSLTVL